MATKKLYNGPVVEYDDQIVRWRKKLKKMGKTSGPHRDKQIIEHKKKAERAKELQELKSGKKKFFE